MECRTCHTALGSHSQRGERWVFPHRESNHGHNNGLSTVRIGCLSRPEETAAEQESCNSSLPGYQGFTVGFVDVEDFEEDFGLMGLQLSVNFNG